MQKSEEDDNDEDVGVRDRGSLRLRAVPLRLGGVPVSEEQLLNNISAPHVSRVECVRNKRFSI